MSENRYALHIRQAHHSDQGSTPPPARHPSIHELPLPPPGRADLVGQYRCQQTGVFQHPSRRDRLSALGARGRVAHALSAAGRGAQLARDSSAGAAHSGARHARDGDLPDAGLLRCELHQRHAHGHHPVPVAVDGAGDFGGSAGPTAHPGRRDRQRAGAGRRGAGGHQWTAAGAARERLQPRRCDDDHRGRGLCLLQHPAQALEHARHLHVSVALPADAGGDRGAVADLSDGREDRHQRGQLATRRLRRNHGVDRRTRALDDGRGAPRAQPLEHLLQPHAPVHRRRGVVLAA